MSYTVPAQPPEARQRPGTVSTAVWLLYLTAALWLVSAILSLAVTSQMSEVFERYFADDPNFTEDPGAAAGVGVAIFIGVSVASALVFIAGLIVAAVLSSRGKNAGRVVAWVVAGLGVCCAGSGLVSGATGGMGGFGTTGSGGGNPEQLETLMNQLIPSWFEPATLAVAALQLVALIAAIVLLALPASNAYFRKQPPAWEPPVPAYPQNPPPAA